MAVVETGTESKDVDSKEEGGEKSSEESSQPDTEAGPDTAASESLVAWGEVPHHHPHQTNHHHQAGQDVDTKHHPHS